MNPIEGVDYSARSNPNSPGSAALKAAGKRFAVRYLADDWRGIYPAEYRELMAGGIDVAAVFETWGDLRQFSGEAQGITDAVYAQNKLLRTGMPTDMPIYFATDWDAQSWEMDEIEGYLRGAAKVIGLKRVGVYGGWAVIDAMQRAGAAVWFWQTSAWEYGRGLHPAAHLYQYDYNQYINGTNCDWTDAYREIYGQASRYDGIPDLDLDLDPEPDYATPNLPEFYLRANVRTSPSSFDFDGRRWYPQRINVRANHDTYCYSRPDVHSPYSGPPVKERAKVAVEWIFEDENGNTWLVNRSGYYFGGRFDPMLTVPKRRPSKRKAKV